MTIWILFCQLILDAHVVRGCGGVTKIMLNSFLCMVIIVPKNHCDGVANPVVVK